MIARIITTGTNTPDTLSAIFAIGAFVAAASLTIFIICDNVVSSPTLCCFTFNKSRLVYRSRRYHISDFFVYRNAFTCKCGFIYGTAAFCYNPASTGILSPGLTTKISPFFHTLYSNSFSSPSFTITAVLGARSISPLSASVVFPLECASSSIFPTVISVRIIAADSK